VGGFLVILKGIENDTKMAFVKNRCKGVQQIVGGKRKSGKGHRQEEES